MQKHKALQGLRPKAGILLLSSKDSKSRVEDSNQHERQAITDI